MAASKKSTKPRASKKASKKASSKPSSKRRQSSKRGRRATPEAQLAPPLPPFGTDAARVDRAAEFAHGAEPPPEDVQRAFVASKLKLLRTHPGLHPLSRAAAAGKYREHVAETLSEADVDAPVPGGVGYGMFFNSAFKIGFATGTAISWEIICPTTPGGNVNTWLYLTATNRTAKGVEAFVSYNGQSAFTFSIFDWARPEPQRWQLMKPFADLGNYLGVETVQGVPTQVLALINSTHEESPGQWVNEVSLLNVPAHQWEVVYRFQYASTLQEQTGDWVGSWGPIVETFQDVHSGTNLMGALKTQFLSRDSNGNWGQWGHLTPTQSGLREDNNGFVKSFLEENFSWGVIS